MPIFIPGHRPRGKRRSVKTPSKRNIVAALQLTAMVDMFTVLVVFLLQNYASTNQVLPISDSISLPQATVVKELKPSYVVVLSKDYLIFNEKKLSSFNAIKNNTDWEITPLLQQVKNIIKKQNLKNKVNKKSMHYKITLQADKDIDFLSIKKVLYTLTLAGIEEVNFAVLKVKTKTRYGIL